MPNGRIVRQSRSEIHQARVGDSARYVAGGRFLAGIADDVEDRPGPALFHCRQQRLSQTHVSP
jgi:hypothetical protein